MTPRTTLTREDIIRRNVEVMAAHLDRESRDIDAALAG
jgi:hypothetical protein